MKKFFILTFLLNVTTATAGILPRNEVIDLDGCILSEYYEKEEYVLPLCFSSIAMKTDGSDLFMSFVDPREENHPTIIPGQCLKSVKASFKIIKGQKALVFEGSESTMIFTMTTRRTAKGDLIGTISNNGGSRETQFIKASARKSRELMRAYKRFTKRDLLTMCK